jgi:hypothetical protein
MYVPMVLNFTGNLSGILMNPVETFRSLREKGLLDALMYFTIVLVIYAALSTIMIMGVIQGFGALTGGVLFPGFGAWMPLLLFLGAIIGGLMLVFIGGAWLHLWVSVFGGRGGYTQTVKSLMYGATPAMLLGWIPLINIIGAIWAFILQILCIRELHEISTGRAVIAVLIAFVIIPVIILVLLTSFLMISAVSTGPIMYPV